MTKLKQNYPEITEIRADLDSLKDNVVELTKHVKQDGKVQGKALKKAANEQVSSLKDTTAKNIERLEDGVKERPGQSVALAFAAGLLTSFFLNR